ncbi:MAG: aminotransferase class IV [Acidimicrobiia bacterium]|nr:aminotransferase class IV [Acidimicrobiia bacterium]
MQRPPVLINGEMVDGASAAVSVFDIGFQRGYGCFEAMRSYGGKPFRIDHHLERLATSAANLQIDIGSVERIKQWCLSVAEPGDGVVRVFVTGGTDIKHPGTNSSIIVFMEPLPEMPDVFTLDIVEAPWHPDGRVSELTGAKTLSYGPNLAATISARSRGFDDAALVGVSGTVLEGPTFSLGWVKSDVVFTPSLDVNILESVTRTAVLEVADSNGIEVHEGSFPVADLLAADEVFVLSTVREVSPVVRVATTEFLPGPVTARLRAGFIELVRAE